MKVLVTGSEGLVGKAVCGLLETDGHGVSRFDKLTNGDILNSQAVAEAAIGCRAIVHSAALLGRPGESASDLMAVNLQGTWNTLLAAQQASIRRIVFLSSVDVLGVFKGESAPDFLPLDESHPCRPTTPYAISKDLAEQMCERFAIVTGISIVCLRPPGVWEDETYKWVVAKRRARPAFEWDPFWEYGAFIDVRDLASACSAALHDDIRGCHRVYVSSNDITTSGETSHELAQRIHPRTEWRGGDIYNKQPYRTLLSNDRARELLRWEPVHFWSEFASDD